MWAFSAGGVGGCGRCGRCGRCGKCGHGRCGRGGGCQPHDANELAEHVLPQWAASQALTSPRGQAPGPRRTRTTWPGAWWNGGLSAPSASAVRERAREGGGRGRGRRVRCSTREAECPGTQAHAGGGTTGAPDAGPIDMAVAVVMTVSIVAARQGLGGGGTAQAASGAASQSRAAAASQPWS